jgi:hypothetical protein
MVFDPVKIIGTACFLVFCFLSVQAQNVIQGMVADSATFNSLPYVTIRVKNKNHGTMTDQKGNFRIQAAPTDTLVLSLLGYETIEQPLYDWETSIIRMPERATVLQSVTVGGVRQENYYEGMFDEQNAQRFDRQIPFYYSKEKKEKKKLGFLQAENVLVQTYVDVVLKSPETKEGLIKKYKLTEGEYYSLLAKFNEKNQEFMYYLTAPELITLLNDFYAIYAPTK